MASKQPQIVHSAGVNASSVAKPLNGASLGVKDRVAQPKRPWLLDEKDESLLQAGPQDVVVDSFVPAESEIVQLAQAEAAAVSAGAAGGGAAAGAALPAAGAAAGAAGAA